MEDDIIIRKIIQQELLPKAEYFKLEQEVDAMLQGMYFKAKKSKTPFKQVVNDYLDKVNLTPEEKKEVLDVWKKRLPTILPQSSLDEGDTYEKMAAKGKKAGNLKQGTVRKRLNIPKGQKIPLSKITKEISRIKKMENPSKKNKKYLKALNLAKTLKTTTNVDEGSNDPGASLGPGPKAGPDGVSNSAYTKQFKYKLVPKTKDGTYVQKGSGMIVKNLF